MHAGAMSDALNQMYVTMLTGQYKFEAYMAFNESRFHDLSDKVNLCTERVHKLSLTTDVHGESISEIKSNMIDRSQFDTQFKMK